MAGATLFTLLDDLASLLDDIATMTKVAVQKTAGVLGDDLALNAYQVSGVSSNRELPVVWAVAKGSLVNKAILVPLALTISALAPWAVTPLLMVGGIYLCMEGVEKVVHRWLYPKSSHHEKVDRLKAIADPQVDMVAFERDRIRGAIRTDFVLSAEIIVISLSTVAQQPFANRVGVMIAISLIMTVGVYGLVAAIVKMDDLGVFLVRRSRGTRRGQTARFVGRFLIQSAPYLLKFLSVAGAIAMFIVGGSIIVHGVPVLQEAVHKVAHLVEWENWIGWLLAHVVTMLLEIVVGLLAGAVALPVFLFAQRLWRRRSKSSSPNLETH